MKISRNTTKQMFCDSPVVVVVVVVDDDVNETDVVVVIVVDDEVDEADVVVVVDEDDVVVFVVGGPIDTKQRHYIFMYNGKRLCALWCFHFLMNLKQSSFS
jgi:hypothetical protein